MKDTLARFTHESLFDASVALLHKLNIQINCETAEPVPFEELYDAPLPQYLATALQSISATYFVGIINDKSLANQPDDDDLDSVAAMAQRGDRYDGMFVFACEAIPGAPLTRTIASQLTRAFNRIASANPVILIIRQGNEFSLSTCERMNYTQEWRQSGGEKLGKVSILRNINCLNPHRGHIDILESLGDEAYPTFNELYKHWMEVFSSELLTKKFYNELSDWYAWAVMVAKFPNDLRTNEDDSKFNHESCIRLITRLIFVWFLKQKHLIPDEFFDEAYIRENLIEEFDPHARKTLLYDAEQSKYYRLILQNLFFAMLNCPIVAEGKDTANNRRFRKVVTGRLNSDYNVNNLMRYEGDFMDDGAKKFVKLANSSVPFLNGGLFDCLDDKPRQMYYDGFSERKESLEQLYLPDYLFFGEEVGARIDLSQWYGDSKKKAVSARGLIDILKKYSFTIEENTPLDQEVSLDPELLGKVFENLLAAFNPETQTSARKQTGSFYTPREIVQYMVDESLVAHLKRMCGEELESKYRDLVSYATEDVELSEEQRRAIMKAIYNCRVLDPACGSGAFPMGMLQQMVHILRQIDPDNEMWNEMMLDIALEDYKKELKKAVANAELKERIEANHQARMDDIYRAFDSNINDPDYARKLYLIEHCIYGVDIQPIATQISKLRFFISLVFDQKPTSDAKSNFGIRPLPNLEAKFVTANTLIPLDRSKDLFTSCDEVRDYEEQLQELNHRIFLSKRNKDKEALREAILDTQRRMAQVMENFGLIGSTGVNQIAAWKMFDQNSSAPFFDPEWMFGVKEGFDVVIGNPPFVDYRKIDDITKNALASYDSYKIDATGSLYVYFIERGVKMLNEHCVLLFINPYQYLSAGSGKGIRSYLFGNSHQLSEIIDVSNIKVFESASTYTCVNTIYNSKEQTDISLYKPSSLKNLKSNHSIVECVGIVAENNYEITLSNNSIIEKIDQITSLLGNVCSVFCGLSASGFRNYVTTESIDTANYKTFVEAKEIKKYITVPRKYIETSIFSTKVLPKFEEECLFMARMTSHMRVGKASRGETAGKVNVLHRFISVDSLYILGLLNSKLLDYYYCVKCESLHLNGGALPFDTETVKRIPIKIGKKNEQQAITELVNSAIQKLKIDNKTNISNIESEIDHLVYHLYNLTYDEVLIIDPETPITREEYETYKPE